MIQPRTSATRPARTPIACSHLRYQPIRDLRSQHVVGIDATVAVPVGRRSAAPSTAEEVVHGVCEQIHAWWSADANRMIPPVSIPLALEDCTDGADIARLLDLPQQHHLPPSCITLAVPLQALDLVFTPDIEHLVTASGTTLQVDGFGLSSVSLVRLGSEAVNVLRLDASLVQGIPGDNGNVETLRAALALGTALEKRVVAQGVDSQDQFECLSGLRCTELRGELSGRPRTAEAVAELFMTRGEGITAATWAPGSNLGTVARITAEISRSELENEIDRLRSLVDG